MGPSSFHEGTATATYTSWHRPKRPSTVLETHGDGLLQFSTEKAKSLTVVDRHDDGHLQFLKNTKTVTYNF